MRSKKTTARLEISARDLAHLALMLRIHSANALEHADICAQFTDKRPLQSWARSSRKAKSLAAQFEMIARDAVSGQTIPGNIRVQ